MLEKWITFIKAHERLCLVVLAGLVLWFAIGKIDTLIANHDHANLQQAQVAAAVQEDKNAALAAQVARQAADYKALADKVEAQNAALAQANVNLATALTKQQKTDAGLPPSELVNRWSTLVPNAKPTVTPKGVELDNTGAVATVQELEKVPTLQQMLTSDQLQLNNEAELLSASEGRVTTLNDEVIGLNTKATLDAKVCSDQIAVVKADARKSKRKWFLAGAIATISLRGAVKIFFGI